MESSRSHKGETCRWHGKEGVAWTDEVLENYETEGSIELN